MVTIVELIEVVLSGMLSLISPEKTADKVNDTNTSKSVKRVSIVLFTLIYVAALVGIIFYLVGFMCNKNIYCICGGTSNE